MDRPTIRQNRDYISINFGHGRVFTMGRSGSKGTNIPVEVFNRLEAFMMDEMASPGGTCDVAFKTAAEKADLLFPGWNQPPATFRTGDKVIGPRGRNGTVQGMARTNVRVQFDGDPYVTALSPFLLQPA